MGAFAIYEYLLDQGLNVLLPLIEGKEPRGRPRMGHLLNTNAFPVSRQRDERTSSPKMLIIRKRNTNQSQNLQ